MFQTFLVSFCFNKDTSGFEVVIDVICFRHSQMLYVSDIPSSTVSDVIWFIHFQFLCVSTRTLVGLQLSADLSTS